MAMNMIFSTLVMVIIFIAIAYLRTAWRWIRGTRRPIFAYMIDNIAEELGEIPSLRFNKNVIILIRLHLTLSFLLFLILYFFPSLSYWDQSLFVVFCLSLIFWGFIVYCTPSVVLNLVNIIASYLFNRRSQLFNERLERGVDLLTNKDVKMRRAGVFVLGNLAKKATTENRKRIMQIIHDFIVTDSQANYAKEKEGKYMGGRREDIENAVKTVIALAQPHKIGRKKISFEVSFKEVDLRMLDFSGLKTKPRITFALSLLSGANFRDAKLNGASFRGAELKETIFEGAKLNEANFEGTQLSGRNRWESGSGFWKAELNRANFRHAILSEVTLSNAKLNEANFEYAKLNKSSFLDAELSETDFYSADCSEVQFERATALTQEQVNQIVFEKGKEPGLPDGLEIPENRAYTWQKYKDGKMVRRFVKSDAEWSEEWILMLLSR